ncbi:MAG: GTPase HflX, partial [Candidatus Latescibacteria bacterium]|nr:GTPase HflX [Candidatus Latescibacterota bacterium]
MHETNADTKTERGIVVGLVLSNMDAQDAQDTLDELALLADTAGVEIIHQITQERNHTDATYLIGSGKAQELAEAVEELDAKVVIFDDDLSPAQTRNLETLVGVKIVDRSR